MASSESREYCPLGAGATSSKSSGGKAVSKGSSNKFTCFSVCSLLLISNSEIMGSILTGTLPSIFSFSISNTASLSRFACFPNSWSCLSSRKPDNKSSSLKVQYPVASMTHNQERSVNNVKPINDIVSRISVPPVVPNVVLRLEPSASPRIPPAPLISSGKPPLA